MSKSATLATVVLERVYDGLTVLFMLLLVLLFVDLPVGQVEGSLITAKNLHTAGWMGLALFAGLLAALQAFRWQRAVSLKVMAWLMRPLPQRISAKVLEGCDAFCDGLAVARASDLVWIGVYSLCTWGCWPCGPGCSSWPLASIWASWPACSWRWCWPWPC